MPYAPAGVGLAIFVLLAVASSIEHPGERQCGYEAAEQHASDALYCVQRARVPEIPGLKTPPPEPEPERDKWRQESDLEAQWAVANWTWWTMVAAFFACGLTGWGVWYVHSTLEANRAAVNQAIRSANLAQKGLAQNRRHAERELRAYVNFGMGNVIGFEPRPNTLFDPMAQIYIKNFGQTPAYDVRFILTASRLPLPLLPIIPNHLRAMMKPFGVLPPGSHIIHQVTLGYLLDDIAERRNVVLGTHAIVVVGWISYFDAFDKWRWTSIRVMLKGNPGFHSNPQLDLETCDQGNHAS